jgi:NhaP-type Na+/H+ or K+/H+ antiporter
MMQIVILLIVGIVLYMGSDWVLKAIEKRRGRRFEQRSLIFFGILLVSAMITFSALQSYLPA